MARTARPRLVKVRVARWYDRKGNRVPKGTAGARRTVEELDQYYALGLPGRPKVRVPLGTTRKDQAERKLAQLVNKGERAEVYGVNPFEGHRDTPLADHLAAYR